MFQSILGAMVGTALAGWLCLAAVCIYFVNRRVAVLAEQHGGRVGSFWGCVPMAYALSLPCFPLHLALGAWMLRTPELARQARFSIVAGFAFGALLLGQLLLLTLVRA